MAPLVMRDGPTITDALESLTKLALPAPNTTAHYTGASNAFSDPFTAGISIVHTVALGILLVLVSITLFHCREQAKAGSKLDGLEAKVSAMNEKVGELKAKMLDVGEGLEKVAQMQKLLSDSDARGVAEEGSGEKQWRKGWAGDVLSRLKEM